MCALGPKMQYPVCVKCNFPIKTLSFACFTRKIWALPLSVVLFMHKKWRQPFQGVLFMLIIWPQPFSGILPMHVKWPGWFTDVLFMNKKWPVKWLGALFMYKTWGRKLQRAFFTHEKPAILYTGRLLIHQHPCRTMLMGFFIYRSCCTFQVVLNLIYGFWGIYPWEEFLSRIAPVFLLLACSTVINKAVATQLKSKLRIYYQCIHFMILLFLSLYN